MSIEQRSETRQATTENGAVLVKLDPITLEQHLAAAQAQLNIAGQQIQTIYEAHKSLFTPNSDLNPPLFAYMDIAAFIYATITLTILGTGADTGWQAKIHINKWGVQVGAGHYVGSAVMSTGSFRDLKGPGNLIIQGGGPICNVQFQNTNPEVVGYPPFEGQFTGTGPAAGAFFDSGSGIWVQSRV